MDDSSILYANLKLPKYPLKDGVEWPIADSGFNKIIAIDNSFVLPELSALFDALGFRIDRLMLWTWNKPSSEKVYDIHTDGHVEKQHVRGCAINWLIEGDSCVDWFSFEGATPKLTYKENSSLSVTEYDYSQEPKHLAKWTGKYPALLNIMQPHQVKVFDTVVPRRSITMRFLPNIKIDQFLHRMSSLLISVNKE